MCCHLMYTMEEVSTDFDIMRHLILVNYGIFPIQTLNSGCVDCGQILEVLFVCSVDGLCMNDYRSSIS